MRPYFCFLIVLFLIYQSFSAQALGKYCILLVNNPNGGRDYYAEVDYGGPAFEKLVNSNGSTRMFTSPVAVLNLLAWQGWAVDEAFDDEHYLLVRSDSLASKEADSIAYEDKLRAAIVWVTMLQKTSTKPLEELFQEAVNGFKVKIEDLKRRYSAGLK